jgi:hypothetical protein
MMRRWLIRNEIGLEKAIHMLVTAFFVLLIPALIVVAVIDIRAKSNNPYSVFGGPGNDVVVLSGPHAGREGRVVSSPCAFNGWHYWLTLNVRGTPEEIRELYKDSPPDYVAKLVEEGTARAWITVRADQVERPVNVWRKEQ